MLSFAVFLLVPSRLVPFERAGARICARWLFVDFFCFVFVVLRAFAVDSDWFASQVFLLTSFLLGVLILQLEYAWLATK